MRNYILKRFFLIFITAAIIIFLVFVFIKMLPNYHAAVLGVDPELRKILEELEGYNKPILEQFVIWIRNIIESGSLGRSLNRTRDVTAILADRIPVSLRLNIVPYLLSIPIGIGLGIWAALKKNKLTDHLISIGVVIFISVPTFVVATLLQYTVVYQLEWLDTPFVASNIDFAENIFRGLASYAMPVVVMTIGSVAGLTRLTRAELTEVLTSEFMLLSRTKGLNKKQATVRHALRNALVPIAPSLLGGFVSILSGSLIIERIFRVEGVGGIYIEAFNNRDYPLIMGYLMFYTVIGLFAGLIVDISYGIIDPRIRVGAGKR
ncbi:ABC transporter permease [Acholeplasma laidlawii]|uniref:ABC transporter permease n=1 Tax=Acholeplasma laidlawii TaxID=2148 RepID=UPI00084C9D61|nr:ABC transporter permease [Acholeplasma laidlawii]OED59116.1 ABC transporter permease [Acholeplasma laidlawii]